MKAFKQAVVIDVELRDEELPSLPQGMSLRATSVEVDNSRPRVHLDLYWGKWFILAFVADTVAETLEALSNWMKLITN